MKRILLLFFVVLTFVGCQSDPDGIGQLKISGQVDNPTPEGQITLERFDAEGAVKIASTTLDGSQFIFEIPEAKQAFYRLNLFDKQYVPFIVGEGDTDVKIKADGSRATGDFEVTGSKANELKVLADQIVADYSKTIKSLQQEARVAKVNQDHQKMMEILERERMAVNRRKRRLKELIWENAPSVSSAYALSYLDIEENFQFVDSVANKFHQLNPDAEYTIALVNRVNDLKENATLMIGFEAPEIELPGLNGETISLSSLRGKYVLIDFWASWCKPCRRENPNVKAVYEIYADKGFEILGVSLDRSEAKWKQAIEVDGLPWKHVLDVRSKESASSTYEVNTIPATFLIDPEGKIVAKGLRGETLKAKLKEIFG